MLEKGAEGVMGVPEGHTRRMIVILPDCAPM